MRFCLVDEPNRSQPSPATNQANGLSWSVRAAGGRQRCPVMDDRCRWQRVGAQGFPVQAVFYPLEHRPSFAGTRVE